LVTLCAYGTQFLRSIRGACGPLVPNFQMEVALCPTSDSQMSTIGSDLQWRMDDAQITSLQARVVLFEKEINGLKNKRTTQSMQLLN